MSHSSLPFVLRLVLISLSHDVHFPFGRFQCPITDFPFCHFWIFFSATGQTPFFNPDSFLAFLRLIQWYLYFFLFLYKTKPVWSFFFFRLLSIKISLIVFVIKNAKKCFFGKNWWITAEVPEQNVVDGVELAVEHHPKHHSTTKKGLMMEEGGGPSHQKLLHRWRKPKLKTSLL